MEEVMVGRTCDYDAGEKWIQNFDEENSLTPSTCNWLVRGSCMSDNKESDNEVSCKRCFTYKNTSMTSHYSNSKQFWQVQFLRISDSHVMLLRMRSCSQHVNSCYWWFHSKQRSFQALHMNTAQRVVKLGSKLLVHTAIREGK